MTTFDEGFQLDCGSSVWSLADLATDPFALRAQHQRNSTVMFETGLPERVGAALVALEGWATVVHLISPHDRVVLSSPSDGDGQRSADDELTSCEGDVPTCWVVYTSGTTGEPKGIGHTISSLTRLSRRNQIVRDLVWGLMYEPTRMAGLQVLLQSMVAGCRLVVAANDGGLARRIVGFRNAGVTALSGTPTMWRKVLLSGEASGWPLRQVTLGGEIADQRLLDALSHAFPEARITHVFASTETGAAFAVSDRRAGFPATFLSEAPEGIGLRVDAGVLQVLHPEMMMAGKDGFVSTGDVVRIEGDRVFFVGRDSGVVNVGGAKVWPEQVEELIRTHPDVTDAVVQSRRNAMTGEILIAAVALRQGSCTDPASIRRWVRERAPLHHVPATVRIVNSIGQAASGKAQRK